MCAGSSQEATPLLRHEVGSAHESGVAPPDLQVGGPRIRSPLHQPGLFPGVRPLPVFRLRILPPVVVELLLTVAQTQARLFRGGGAGYQALGAVQLGLLAQTLEGRRRVVQAQLEHGARLGARVAVSQARQGRVDAGVPGQLQALDRGVALGGLTHELARRVSVEE